MTEYTTFRQRLDAVLRTLDVKQVQEFLQAEKQWGPETPGDPEFAMYMMVVGSSALRDLHDRALRWLVTHGHEEEAQAVLGRQQRSGGASKKPAQRGGPQGQRGRNAGKGPQHPARNATKRNGPRGQE
jgi:hypothetical protein